MFIIKVRDHLTARTRETCSENGFRILRADAEKWKACLLRYKTLEEALHFVTKQSPCSNGKNRFALVRDYRIFEQDGRKLKLVFEKIGEEE